MDTGSGVKSRSDGRPRHPLRSNSAPGSRPRPLQTLSKKASSASLMGTGASASQANAGFADEIKYEVMASYLYQQQCGRSWAGKNAKHEGCVVRKTQGEYQACPSSLTHSKFVTAVQSLNPQCAMTVGSRVIKAYLQLSPNNTNFVAFTNDQRIQMVSTMAELRFCRPAQCAAFVVDDRLLVVWDDDVRHLVDRAAKIEQELMDLVWDAGKEAEPKPKLFTSKGTREITRVKLIKTDEETGKGALPKRGIKYMNTILVSMTLVAMQGSICAAIRHIVMGTHLDSYWPRLGLMTLLPIQVIFTLFFGQVIFGSIAQILGPIRQAHENSKFYSGQLPVRLEGAKLPHLTIQCPVYKEGLEAVIAPTIRSLKEAITVYELQGGSVNLFINDDGIQLLTKEEREARIRFYRDNNVGWVARPPHGQNGFQRRGKFKKASNMNYALMISNKVEDLLVRIKRGSHWTDENETEAYTKSLQQVLRETGNVAWAEGFIRMGAYILLVDSDTRVPADCLLDAVSEMEQSPEVGILQFSSAVMQVVHHFFENGITFFTDLIYSAIRYTVANGDVAPFVGHNAIIRWSALRQVSYMDADRYEKFWSESHVSEDFDMSLRLQNAGYTVRLAAWAGEGFKEGVSLTVYDELARWEKYAYGCNELLFNPFRYWISRGPLTPQCRGFLSSSIPVVSKITIISYIGTYYAIASAWILTLVNYFLKGWFSEDLDKFYLDSWQVWFSIVVIFNCLASAGLAVMRYRVQERSLTGAIIENLQWTVMLAIFLGGLSIHLSVALLSHGFEVDMAWGATAKEAEASNFFVEMPKILKKFKYTMMFSFTLLVLMVVLGVAPFVPEGWRITDFVAILPLATVAVSHFLLPLALNPDLMKLSF
ncbi:hypothetical protein N0V93_009479 [Gnomoniopsis smithogilvyi]|uniref:Glycosyltransferase 2-like domain-containing protein n=1 Tax=Gnomoniopsis smithogilvyi TaxID=1191159 RepID=A0A9W8YL58_9PEZI|nr:hypothetical protein N0V93_009479 [Gnomoniopsis smithogilvyi]